MPFALASGNQRFVPIRSDREGAAEGDARGQDEELLLSDLDSKASAQSNELVLHAWDARGVVFAWHRWARQAEAEAVHAVAEDDRGLPASLRVAPTKADEELLRLGGKALLLARCVEARRIDFEQSLPLEVDPELCSDSGCEMGAGVVLKLDADAGPGSELVIAQVPAKIVLVVERAMHDTEIDLDVDRSGTIPFASLLLSLRLGLVLLFDFR